MEGAYALIRRAIEERQQGLPLDGLTEISVHDGQWHTRAHSEPQHCVDEVDLEVDP